MAVNNSSIALLDMNYGSLCLLNELTKSFPNEVFYYLNDFNGANFDEWSHKAVIEKIKEDTEVLLAHNPKLIVILASEYIEFAKEYFLSLAIPVINIVDMVIDSLNQDYDKKNIAFLATPYVHHANLYQRNINYSHFYPLDASDLERIVLNDKVKTGISFDVVKRVLADLNRKAVDVIASSTYNPTLLTTEIKEVLPKTNILNIASIIAIKITNCLDTNDNEKLNGKGVFNIIADKEFMEETISKLLKCKYAIKQSFNGEKKRSKE